MLRKLAKAEADARVARRLLAIANALSGMSRKEAAEAAGMDRQTLRDWVIRYNAHGPDGLCDCWGEGRPPRLEAEEQAELMRIVLAGPDPDARGFRPLRARIWCASAKPASARPSIPPRLAGCLSGSAFRGRRRGQATRKKTRPKRRPLKRAPALLQTISIRHKGKRLRLFFQDEARIGQKGRVCHIWWKRGERPPGLCDKRFTFAYIFAAVEPGTDNAFALVMPYADTAAMQAFLDRFSETLAEDEHAVMVLDQAGWHGSNALAVPANITLVPLPAYSPELNPVERVWLYLKERFLSHRLLADYDAIVDAACNAWNRLVAEAGRIKSLCSYPWIPEVNV